MMKRFVSIIVVFMLLFSLSACSDTTVKGSVVRESTYGNAELDIMPQKLMENIIVGDTVLVTIGDFSEEMPFVDILIAEDGKLQLFFDKEDHNINICIYNQRFCDTYDIEVGAKVTIKKNKRKSGFMTGSILNVGPKNPECDSVRGFTLCVISVHIQHQT